MNYISAQFKCREGPLLRRPFHFFKVFYHQSDVSQPAGYDGGCGEINQIIKEVGHYAGITGDI
jgi:hypothetical protein